MSDGKRDEKKEEGRHTGHKTPPRIKDFPLETPYYEEQFDPYFTEKIEPVKEDDRNRALDPEEDWYWREPDNYWLEEGMWPWPEPRPKPKDQSKPPEDIEPPG